MKVFIIAREPFPNGMAATNRIKNYAKGLMSAGIECEVIIFSRTERYGQTPHNLDGQGIFEGIHFRYSGGTPLRGSNVLIRRINDWKDKHDTKRYLKNNLRKGDIVLFYASDPADFVKSLVKIVHSVGGKAVRELCELPFAPGAQNKAKERKRNHTLRKIFPLFDGFLAISEPLSYIAYYYKSPSAKVLRVPILVDTQAYKVEDTSLIQSPQYIFHCGTLTEQKDGVIGMLKAFGETLSKIKVPVKYILTGSIASSPVADELRQIISDYNLSDNVEFIGFLKEDAVRHYLSGASLVISNKRRTQQNYYGFSTKVGEYLMAAVPLVTTDWGETPRWLKDGESAYIVEAENVCALSDAIARAFNNPQERVRIGLGGQAICEKNFDYKAQGRRIAEFFRNI